MLTELSVMWPESPIIDGPVGPTEVVIHPPSKEIRPSVNGIMSPVVNRVKEELLNLEQEPNHMSFMKISITMNFLF